MKVKDICATEIPRVEPSSSLREVLAVMTRHNVGVIPVCERGRILGMLTLRDLVLSWAADMKPEEHQVKEVMSSSLVSVSPDTDLEEAVRIMGKEQLHRLLVVDGGKLVGIVSIWDISRAIEDDKLIAETLRKISEPA